MYKEKKFNYYFGLLFAVFSVLSLGIASEVVEINLVYTNDIHDCIRPSYSGVGGLPYVAGFVKQLRTKETNILLVDAGDLTDKGDMVADVSGGEIMYQAVAKIGYQVMVSGNHDLQKGVDRLCELKAIAPSIEFVATDYNGGLERCYKPWVIKKIGNMSIGFIGIVKFGIEEAKKAIAEMQGQGCNFFIALCHVGSSTCAAISKKIPEISIFVSGHTHELLQNEIVCPDTNSIIVQAGSRAVWVGHLKLYIDSQSRKITHYENRIVELKHELINPDEDFLNWLNREEERICPIANDFLIDNKKPIVHNTIAMLIAYVVKEKTNADIVFSNPKLVRNVFPPTRLDYNALFLTWGHRAVEKEWIQISLTGHQIEQYLRDLIKYRWDRTEYVGLKVDFNTTDKDIVKTDLVLDKKYNVAITKAEFQNQLMRSLQKNEENNIGDLKNGLRECDFTYLDVMAEFMKKVNSEGFSLDEYIDKMGIKSHEEK